MSRTLMTAAARGDLPLLEKVLRGDLGELDHDDVNQALLRAAQNGNLDCVERLLGEGGEMDCDDTDGDTPLMLAAANDNIEVVRLLVHFGCDVDLQSDHDRSALHMAVWNRCLDIIDLLLDIGCDVNLQERYGDTPIMLAVRRGYPDVIRKLLQREDLDIDTRSYEKDTALHYAAQQGHLECMRLLLDSGADIEPKTFWGITPLLVASMNGNDECALTLLEAGANLEVKDRSQKTTLHYISMKNCLQSLKFILEKGTDPNVADSDGISPIFEAVHHDNIHAIHLLIQHGANVHAIGKATIKGKYGFCSCLELSLHRGNLQAARMLAAAGASVNDLQIFCDNFPNIHFDENIYQWINDFLRDPLSLQALCRCSVRDVMKNNMMYKVQHLPLPRAIMTFLTFEDLTDE